MLMLNALPNAPTSSRICSLFCNNMMMMHKGDLEQHLTVFEVHLGSNISSFVKGSQTLPRYHHLLRRYTRSCWDYIWAWKLLPPNISIDRIMTWSTSLISYQKRNSLSVSANVLGLRNWSTEWCIVHCFRC